MNINYLIMKLSESHYTTFLVLTSYTYLTNSLKLKMYIRQSYIFKCIHINLEKYFHFSRELETSYNTKNQI